MEKLKKRMIEKKGWKVGHTDEFLGLKPEESALIDLKIRLGDCLKERRLKAGLTQVQLAKLLKTSQSRVAKMEVVDPLVSVDLLLKALFHLGLTRKQLALKIKG